MRRLLRRLLPTRRLRGPRSQSIRRLSLPNGAWWDIETRPTLRQFLAIQEFTKLEDENEGGLTILAYLTDQWSFKDPPTVETVKDRNIDDLLAVMEIYGDDVAPFLQRGLQRLNRNGSSTTSRVTSSQGSTS